LSRTKPTRSERASAILENRGIDLPPEIAADLLAAVEADWSMTRYPENLTFTGASAIAVAASDEIKAEVIATRTPDLPTQRALYESAKKLERTRVIEALARSKYMTDPTLRGELHDNLLAQNPGSTTAVLNCPGGHIVDWLENNQAGEGYPYRMAAESVAKEPAGVILRFVKICETNLGDPESANHRLRSHRYKIEDGFSALGQHLARSGEQTKGVEVAKASGKTARFYILTALWHQSDRADGDLTRAIFDLIEERGETELDIERHQRSSERHEPYVPRLVKHRDKVEYDEESLKILAEKTPAMLEPMLRSLGNGDPLRDLLVEISLKSREAGLARALLERRYHSDGIYDGPILPDGSAYREAVDILDASGANKPYGSVRYIPKDADVEDVIRATGLESHGLGFLYESMFEPQDALRPAWQPEIEDFLKIVEKTGKQVLKTAVHRGTANLRTSREEPRRAGDDPGRAIARKYLDAAADLVNADELCSQDDGLAYVAMRLGEAYSDDVAGFDQALHLSTVSSKPFREVLKAAKKLH